MGGGMWLKSTDSGMNMAAVLPELPKAWARLVSAGCGLMHHWDARFTARLRPVVNGRCGGRQPAIAATVLKLPSSVVNGNALPQLPTMSHDGSSLYVRGVRPQCGRVCAAGHHDRAKCVRPRWSEGRSSIRRMPNRITSSRDMKARRRFAIRGAAFIVHKTPASLAQSFQCVVGAFFALRTSRLD